MKKIIITFLLAFCFSSLHCYSQNQANHWYFGNKAGLNFNKENPVATNESGMNAFTSPSVISDPITGELLFYSNGSKVWDRTHQVMPHGLNLFGNNSVTTQTTLIVPYPSNSTLYYLFTLFYTYDSPGAELYYHIVDLSLNDGKGDIIPSEKNKFLLGNLAGKLQPFPMQTEEIFGLLFMKWGQMLFE